MSLDVKILHNPKCGTSRNVLAMIRNAGIEPEIIDYLKAPPSRDELHEMIVQAGLSVRDAMRAKEKLYSDLGLQEASLSDEQLLTAMVENPILINRPFVISPMGVRLCRPSELVLEILPETHQGAFSKEDGEQVLDEKGKRLV